MKHKLMYGAYKYLIVAFVYTVIHFGLKCDEDEAINEILACGQMNFQNFVGIGITRVGLCSIGLKRYMA